MHNLDIHTSGGGTDIPKTNTSGKKTGSSAGSVTGTETREPQETFDLGRQKLELEKERASLQSDIDKQRAEAERDLFKATIERDRTQATSMLEQLKIQGELFAKILPQPATKSPKGKIESGVNSGYVSELVSFHAIKRISSDIARGIGTAVGLGNDVRIMIVGSLDYAKGDIPFIEVTSQLSVFDVRCRKQVATNKELIDLVIQKEGLEGDEKTPPTKTGTTRLASLAASPLFLPAVIAPGTVLPTIPGIAGTAADIAGHSSPVHSFESQSIGIKTQSLIAAVAGSLRSEKRYVYVYNFYSMDTTGPQSKLMNMYAGTLDCSSRLAQSRNRLQYFITKKTGLLAELKLSLKKLGEELPMAERQQAMANLNEEIKYETAWLDRAKMEILASDAIHTEQGTLIKNITTADASQPASKLAQAVFREKVHELGITHLLYVGVLSSGGESVTRKWLFGTGTTSYMGGAVASYVLARVEGDILASDILPVLYSFGFDPADQRNSPLKQIRFEKQDPKK